MLDKTVHGAEADGVAATVSVRGAAAFGGSEVYGDDVDWDAIDAEAAENGGDWSGSEWQDERFTVAPDQTLDLLRAELGRVADRTAEVLRTADLEAEHALPEAPWFEAGAQWSVRRVALHLVA